MSLLTFLRTVVEFTGEYVVTLFPFVYCAVQISALPTNTKFYVSVEEEQEKTF